ncbi:MAG: helix-turn-helix transcriptional regulator [Deltaproteobacteria bacterium]|nr:helix-turn-helix transcriptional regulator [Deltaproteobacteria bacterium]
MARVEPAQRNSGTREVIFEAAERLFAERGFADTSVRDIVGEAETSAPSLYHFFGSKENLVVELIADRHEAYCEELEGELASAKTAFEVCQRFVKPRSFSPEESLASARASHLRPFQVGPAAVQT